MVFNFHIFVTSPNYLLLLISHFTPLWKKVSHRLLGVAFTHIWWPWEEEGSLDEDACHLTLGPLGCGEFQMLISFLQRCFIFGDNSPGLWKWGWSLTHDFLRCLRLCLALTLHPLPSSGSSSFSPARREASPPALVLGLLPHRCSEHIYTQHPLSPAPCPHLLQILAGSRGRRAFPRDVSKEEEDETIPTTSLPSPSPSGPLPQKPPTASHHPLLMTWPQQVN